MARDTTAVKHFSKGTPLLEPVNPALKKNMKRAYLKNQERQATNTREKKKRKEALGVRECGAPAAKKKKKDDQGMAEKQTGASFSQKPEKAKTEDMHEQQSDNQQSDNRQQFFRTLSQRLENAGRNKSFL